MSLFQITLLSSALLFGTAFLSAAEKEEKAEESMHEKELKASELLVAIDVEPGDSSNTVDLKEEGSLEIALFGSEDFDVDQVDRSSLTVGEAKVQAECRVADINWDGMEDLVCSFDKKELKLSEDSKELTLKGETLEGRSFEGSDMVSFVDQKRVKSS